MNILDPRTIDEWTENPSGPVALHLRETLMPVEGNGAVIFPPTYAVSDNRSGPPYAIDVLRDGTKVVQIDSVGSQANRMEPLFRRPNPLAKLVPQIEVKVSEDASVSLLDVGHRLGDAFVRCSSIMEDAAKAFADFAQRGDATAIAKLAPTSLVFGAWDSRGQGAKLPRLVQSVIRAWNVDVLRRSAQYKPPINYVAFDIFSNEEKAKKKEALAQRGFVDLPSVDAHGGIVVHGEIYRDITINLVALRQLGAPSDGAVLRRYILGLALVAATEPQDGFLRQGCLLTPDPKAKQSWSLINRDGSRDCHFPLDSSLTFEYATSAAEKFVVGPDKLDVTFSRERAKADASRKDKSPKDNQESK